MNNIIEIIVQEMKLRNYSQRTIDAYIFVVKDLYKYYKKPSLFLFLGLFKKP